MYYKIEDQQGEVNRDYFRGKDVILFGAGTYGQKVVEEVEEMGASVLFFCDNNPKLFNTKIFSFDQRLKKEYWIKNPAEIYEFPNAKIIISSTYFEEVKQQLVEMGMQNIFTIKTGVHRDTIPNDEFKNEFLNKDNTNKLIISGIRGKKPFFIGRIGSTELETICHYIYLEQRKKHLDIPYQNNVKTNICVQTGFFPKDDQFIDQFVERYLGDIKTMDIIWTMWSSKFEDMIYTDYAPSTPIADYEESYFPISMENSWIKELEGKKVLIIHPFEDSIKENYKIHNKLFPKGDEMPDFELITLRAVQSLAGEKTEFTTWFDALAYMEDKIAKIDFDIALIGAGGYGLPLGAYIKSLGKKAIHIGGALQLFFGIKGKFYDKLGLYNEYWKSPSESERPKGYCKVESGRYW